ncbi:hypothetical protein GCM10009735_02340 [Actinomadura chokoriensis]
MRRAGMSLVLAAVLAAGCGTESGGKAEAASPSAAPASPAAAGLTESQVKPALPDPHAMGAWEPVTRGVNSAKATSTAPASSSARENGSGTSSSV